MLIRHNHHLIILANYTTAYEIFTLSLHDALPISGLRRAGFLVGFCREDLQIHRPAQHAVEGVQELARGLPRLVRADQDRDRKSTRLNSSHVSISYAVFCLKKKTTVMAKNEPLPNI